MRALRGSDGRPTPSPTVIDAVTAGTKKKEKIFTTPVMQALGNVQLGSSLNFSEHSAADKLGGSHNLEQDGNDSDSSESSKSSWESDEERQRQERKKLREQQRKDEEEQKRREKQKALNNYRNRSTRFNNSGTLNLDDDSSLDLSDEEDYVKRKKKELKKKERERMASDARRLEELREWEDKQREWKKDNDPRIKEKEEEEKRKKSEEEERKRQKAQQEEERRRLEDERRRLEEEKRQKAEELRRKKADEERRRIAEAEEAARREEARLQAIEKERKLREEKERKQREEEEARQRKRAEEEAAEDRRRQEKEAAEKRKQEIEAAAAAAAEKKQREEEAQRKREEQEAAEKKRKNEEAEERIRRREEKDREQKRKEEERQKKRLQRAEEANRKKEKKEKNRLEKAREKLAKAASKNFNHNVTNISKGEKKKTRAELAKEAEKNPRTEPPRPGHDVYQKRIAEVDPDKYEAPHFEKTEKEKKTIARALSKILPVGILDQSKNLVNKLINAFEKKDYSAGASIEMESALGSVGTDESERSNLEDYFYVVEEGNVAVEVDGKEVAHASAGDTLGDTNLYHGSSTGEPRQPSVIKVKPDKDGRGASLMRIDQSTYRTILQTQQHKSDQDRLNLVEQTDFFRHMSPAHKQRLAAALKPLSFEKGESVSAIDVKSMKTLFFVVSSGRLTCCGGERADLKESKTAEAAADEKADTWRPVLRGQHFGDQVLEPAGDLLWYDTPLTVKAQSEGLAYVIDRAAFEAVVGKPKDVLLTPAAAYHLQKMEMLKTTHLQEFTIAQLQALQSKFEERYCNEEEIILEKGVEVPAALYVVRQGTVKVKVGRFHHLKIAGGVFGEEMFEAAKKSGKLMGTPEHTVLAKSDCVVSRLTVEDFLSLDLSIKKGEDTESVSSAPKSPPVKTKVLLTKKEKAERLKQKEKPQAAKPPSVPSLDKKQVEKEVETNKKVGKAKLSDDSSASSDSSDDSSEGTPRKKTNAASKATVTTKHPKEPASKPKKLSGDRYPPKVVSKEKKLEKSSRIAPPLTKPKPQVVEKEDEEVEYIVPKRNIKFENLVKKVMLGEGQFGQVWLVTDKTENEKRAYALKIQSKFELVSQAQAEICIREKTIMEEMRHPHIIKLYASYQDEHFVYLLLEMVNGGELFNQIYPIDEDYENNPQHYGLAEEHAKFYTFVIADILKYMHEKKYVYRDLKPENILIGANGYPVLIDFGFAKKLTKKTFTLCGTPGYLSPEMVLSLGHSFAVDHWALGILTYEMMTRQNFFFPEGMDPVSLYKCIAEDEFEPPEDQCSKEACDFMNQMLHKDPILRLGSLVGGENDVLMHPWFRGWNPKMIRSQKLKAPWIPNVKDTMDTSHFEDWSDVEDKTAEKYPPLSEKQELIFEDF